MKKQGKIVYLDGTTPEGVPQEGDGNGKGKKRRRGPSLRALITGGLAIVLALAAVWILFLRGSASMNSLAVAVEDLLQGKSYEENFPLDLDGMQVMDVNRFGPCFGLLTDVKYQIYSPHGNLLSEYQHNMHAPQVETSPTRAMLYERGNYRVVLHSRKQVEDELTLDQKIITACINDRNYYAIATESDRYLAQFSLYTPNGEALLTWYSSDNYIVDIAISPDAKKVAVALVQSQQGELRGGVYIFRTNNAEGPVQQYTYTDETILSVAWHSNSMLSAVGENKTYFYDGDGQTTGEYDYAGNTLAFFSQEEDDAVLLGFQGTDAASFRLVERTGAVRDEMTVAGAVQYLFFDEGEWNFVLAEKLLVYRQVNGKYAQSASMDVGGDVIKLLPNDEKLLILTLEALQITDKP